MTKRRNPFDDTHFLQKMHIGVKEVNLGVNHVENMKKVYGNTMKMLYNGSMKKVQDGIFAVQSGIPAVQNGLPAVQNGASTVQKEISAVQNGSINGNGFGHLHHKMSDKNFVTSDKQGKVIVMNPCCSSNLQICCTFCERIMCTTCRRICQSCSYEFCHLCSILQYDSQEETAVCLSCM